MIHSNGIVDAGHWWPITFHLPRLGGWKNYVVLEPTSGDGKGWHVGWIAGNVIGVSRIPLNGPVRVLVGSGKVSWFGVNSDGGQIKLRQVGIGRIGDGGTFAKIPLL